MATVYYQLILILILLYIALLVNARSGSESKRLNPSALEEVESYMTGAAYSGWGKSLAEKNPRLEELLQATTASGQSRR